MFAWAPAFWVLPSTLLSDSGAAAGFALINSAGSIGSFAGPSLVGLILTRTGSFSAAVTFVSMSLVAAAIFVLLIRYGQSVANTERGAN